MAHPQPLTLRDPAALKALAHPVRQDLISMLSDDRVITATEASGQVGMSPSAVSHHLRLLEKYGIVERVEPSGDSRERPWRLRPGGISLVPSAGDTAGQAATMVLLRRENERQLALMEQLLATLSPADGEELDDEEVARFAFTRARLTYEEAVELVRRIELVADEMRASRDQRASRPTGPAGDSDDLVEYSLAWSFLPTQPAKFARLRPSPPSRHQPSGHQPGGPSR